MTKHNKQILRVSYVSSYRTRVKRSSSAKNIINIGRYHAVGSLTVHVTFTMCPKVKQSSLAKNIINVTECIVYMFRAMTL